MSEVNICLVFFCRAKYSFLTKYSNQVLLKRKSTMRQQNQLSQVSGHTVLYTVNFYFHQ